MVSFSLGSVSFLLISVFIIATLGYMLGRITIKGVSLGTAGVFIVALAYGAIFGPEFTERIRIGEVAYASEALKTVENLGLILFVTSVGFIAGPNFFKNMKKNFKSYVLLGLVIILTGGVATVACVYIDRLLEAGNNTDPGQITAIITGILSGALTSTPAFSATKEAVQPEYTDAVTVGYGIAYLFGVIGVVLFVQLMPKFVHANMDEERSKLIAADVAKEEKKASRKLIDMDDFGLMPFALAAVLGVLVGSVKFFKLFSLTTTGGTLLASLLFGHFGHIGPVNIMPQKTILFAGVTFMGESAKILNPDKTVVMADECADCPMAHMITADRIAEVREEYEDLAVVCYVNSTAEIKAVSDVCVTSSNAVKVVSNIPQKNIFFVPDNNLGRYVAEKLPEKHFIFHDGFCHVHKSIHAAELQAAKDACPDALVLTHPECTEDVVAMSDFVGSTSEIIDFATQSDCKKFIICTEMGVFFELQQKNPDKKFYSVGHRQFCPNMKKVTIDKVEQVLEKLGSGELEEITLSDEILTRAAKPLQRMLELAK